MGRLTRAISRWDWRPAPLHHHRSGRAAVTAPAAAAAAAAIARRRRSHRRHRRRRRCRRSSRSRRRRGGELVRRRPHCHRRCRADARAHSAVHRGQHSAGCRQRVSGPGPAATWLAALANHSERSVRIANHRRSATAAPRHFLRHLPRGVPSSGTGAHSSNSAEFARIRPNSPKFARIPPNLVPLPVRLRGSGSACTTTVTAGTTWHRSLPAPPLPPHRRLRGRGGSGRSAVVPSLIRCCSVAAVVRSGSPANGPIAAVGAGCQRSPISNRTPVSAFDSPVQWLSTGVIGISATPAVSSQTGPPSARLGQWQLAHWPIVCVPYGRWCSEWVRSIALLMRVSPCTGMSPCLGVLALT